MLSRRYALLLFAALGASSCASRGEEPPAAEPEVADMLFISPMGEPFRAKPPAPYPVVDWFKGADRNGDGRVDRAEFLADAERFFHVLDINKDGVIDHREIYYYEHRTVPEILGPAAESRNGAGSRLWLASNMTLAQAGPGGLGGGGGVVGSGAPPPDSSSAPRQTGPSVSGGGAAPFTLLGEPEPVQSSDIRLSGLISMADFRTRAGQRFDFLDEGHRGYLTLASLPETEAQRSLPHPKRPVRRA